MQVNSKDASKKNWNTEAINQFGYPGDEKIKLGCLMRIADAVESMAVNYIDLQNRLNSIHANKGELALLPEWAWERLQYYEVFRE